MPSGVMKMIEANKSAVRLGDFLMNEEVPHRETQSFSQNAISIKNGTFCWNDEKETLKDINLEIGHKQFVAVIGKVGSGKSSLLAAILNEIEMKCGQISIDGKIAYAPQQTWLRNQSLRENVLFDEPWNSERFKKVIKASCLKKGIYFYFFILFLKKKKTWNFFQKEI